MPSIQYVVLGSALEVPPGEGRNFMVAGKLIAVFHTRGGGFFAAQAECPHKRGPLADGLVGPQSVICPLHEWKFNLATGQRESGQRASDHLSGPCASDIEVYPVNQDTDGQLVVAVPW